MSHPQTILITGSNSLLGTSLTNELKHTFNLVLCYHKTKPAFLNNVTIEQLNNLAVQLDITDVTAVQKVIRKYNPTTVIHLASISDIDYCEHNHQKAHTINVDGTKTIIQAIEKFPNIKLVFLSSSAVFDGTHAPSTENITPHPITIYGKSKLQAEQNVQKMQNPWLIIRSTTLFGWPPKGARDNPVTWIVKTLSATSYQLSAHVPIVSDYFTNPLYAPSAATYIAQLLKLQQTGIFHMAGATRVSRFAWAKQIARTFGLDAKGIKPVKMAQFKNAVIRPHDLTLATKKLEQTLGITVPTLSDGLKQMKKDQER